MSELDHPCKNTCSGWKQGYEKGYDVAQARAEASFKVAVDECVEQGNRVSDLQWKLARAEAVIAEAIECLSEDLPYSAIKALKAYREKS